MADSAATAMCKAAAAKLDWPEMRGVDGCTGLLTAMTKHGIKTGGMTAEDLANFARAIVGMRVASGVQGLAEDIATGKGVYG